MSVIRAAATLDIRGFVGGLQTMVSQTNATVNSIQTRLQNLEQAGNRAFASMAASSKAASKGISADFEVLSDAEKKLLSVQTAFNGLFRAGSQLASVGKSILVMGAAIDAVGFAAIKAAQDTDFFVQRTVAAATVANEFAASMGHMADAQATSAQMSALVQKGVEGIAATVGLLKPQEIAEGFYAWSSAMGTTIATAEDVDKITPIILEASKAAGISGEKLTDVVRGIAGLLSQMQLDASQAPAVIAAVSNAAGIAQAEIGDMIQSFKFVGPLAAASGIGVGELVGVVSKLSDVGIKGSQAGRGLQQVIQGFVKPSKEAQDALQLLFDTSGNAGQKWSDILFPGGQFVGILDKITESGNIQKGAISLLADATQNMSQASMNWYVAQLGDANAVRQIIPLVQDEVKRRQERTSLLQQQATLQDQVNAGNQAAIADLQQVNAQLADLDQKDPAHVMAALNDGIKQITIFEKGWDAVADSIKNRLGVEMNKLQLAFADLGTAAAGAIIPLLTQINTMLAYTRGWISANRELFQTLVQFAAGLSAVLVVVGAINLVAGQLLQFYTIIHSTMAALGPFLAVMTNVGVLFSGMGLAVLAVVAAIITLSQTGGAQWQQFTNTLTSAGRDIIAVFVSIVTEFAKLLQALQQGNVEQAMEHLKEIIVNVVSYIALYVPTLIAQMFQSIVQMVDRATGGLATMFYIWGQNIINQLAAGMLEGAKLVARAVGFITGLISAVFKGYSPPREGPLKDIRIWGKNLAKSLAEGFSGAEWEVSDAVDKISKKISDKLEGHSPPKEGKLKDIDEWGKNVGEAYVKGFEKAHEKADEAAEKIGKTLSKKLEGHSPTKEGPMANIDEWGTGPAQAYTDNIEHTLVAGMDDAAQKAGEAIEKGLSDHIPAGIERAEPRAYDAGRTFMDGLLNTFRKADFGTLNEIADTVSKTLEVAMTNALSGLDMTKDENKQKKIDLANVLFTNTQESRTLIAETISDMNQKVDSLFENFQGLDNVKDSMKAFGEQVRASLDPAPVEKLAALVGNGTVADDLKNMVAALSDVDAAQKFKDEIDNIITKSQDIRNAHQDIIDKLKDEIATAAQIAKEPLQDQLDKINDVISALDDVKQKNKEAFQPTQDAIDRLKTAKQNIDDIVAGIRDQISDQQDLLDPINSQLDAIAKTKQGLDDEITAIKARYDLERKADQDHLDALQLQIDKTNVMNDQLNLAAEEAIANAKAAGAPLAVINAMQRQLELVKQRQQFETQTLQIQKQQEEISSKEREQQRTTQENSEIDAVNARKKVVEQDEQRLNNEKANIQKQIDLLNNQIKAQEKNQRALDSQGRILDQQQRAYEAQQALVDKDIERARQDEANINKRLQAIDKEAAQRTKTEVDPLQAALKEEDINLRILNNRRQVIEQELAAAKDRLDIQKAISDEHQKDLQAQQKLAQDISSSSKAGQNKPGDPFAATGPTSGSLGFPNADDIKQKGEEIAAQVKAAADKLFASFLPSSDQLEEQKRKTQEFFDSIISQISTEFHRGQTENAGAINEWGWRIHQALTEVTKGIEAIANGDLPTALAKFRNAWYAVGDPLADEIGRLFSGLGTIVNDKVGSLIDGMNTTLAQKGRIRFLMFDTEHMANDVLSGISGAFNSIKDGITKELEKALSGQLTFDQLGKDIYDGIKKALTWAYEHLGGDVAAIGGDFKGLLAGAFGADNVQALTTLGTLFKELGDTIKNFASAGEQVFGPLMSILITFGQVIGYTIIETFRQVGQVLADNGPELHDALTQIGDVIKFLLPILGAFVTAFIVTFVQGVVHLIEAIGNIIKGFRMMWEAITEHDFGKFFSGLGTVFHGALEGILGLLEVGLVGRIVGIFGGIGTRISSAAGSSMAAVGPSFSAIFSRLSVTLAGYMNNLILAVLRLFVNLGTRIAAAVGPLLGDVPALFGKMFADMMSGFSIFGDLWVSLLSNLSTQSQTVLVNLAIRFAEILAPIIDIVTGIGRGIVEAFLGNFGTVIALVESFIHSIIQFFQNLYDTLVGHSIIPDMINAIVDLFTSLPDKILHVIEDFVHAVGDKFDQLGTLVHDSLQAAINGAIDFVTNEAPKIGNDLIQGVMDGAKTIWDTILKPFIDGLFGSGSGDSILGVIQQYNPITFLVSVGSQILQGLSDGITTFWNDTLKPWIDGLLGLIQNILSSANPLQALLDVGTNIMQGLMNGLQSKWSELSAWLGTVIPAIGNIFNLGDILQTVQNAGVNIINNLMQGIQNAWANVPDWIKRILGGGTITTTTQVTQDPSGSVTSTTSANGGGVPMEPGNYLTDPSTGSYAEGGVLGEPVTGFGEWSGRKYTFAEGGTPELIFNRLSAERLDAFVTAALANIDAFNASLNAGPMNTVGVAPNIGVNQYQTHLHVGVLVADRAGLQQLEQQLRPFRQVENARRLS